MSGIRMREKYPNKIPLLVTESEFVLSKKKYLVPNDLTVGSFLYTLRKYSEGLNESEAIFLFFGEKLYPITEKFITIYEKEKNDEGMLELKVMKEQTFGENDC